MQQSESRPHHGAPLVVAQPVLHADRVLLEPGLQHGAVDVVVVAPALVAGVVNRVYEDAVHLAGIQRQQTLQRVQVVAVNDEIVVQPPLADALGGVRHQRPVRHGQMMVVDEFLALENQFRHVMGSRDLFDGFRRPGTSFSGRQAVTLPAALTRGQRARRAGLGAPQGGYSPPNRRPWGWGGEHSGVITAPVAPPQAQSSLTLALFCDEGMIRPLQTRGQKVDELTLFSMTISPCIGLSVELPIAGWKYKRSALQFAAWARLL